MSPLPIFGLCLSTLFPLFTQAQSVSDADERPVTTIRSTIIVVPVAYTATIYTTETPPAEESAVVIIAPAPYEGNDTAIAPSGTGAADDNVGTITVTESSLTSPTPTTAVCEVDQVTCPACDGEVVSVDTMSFYTIKCDASLSSYSVIDQPSYITPAQCLLTCESTPHCVGTTQFSNGTCSLVVGTTYKVESSATSDIAFIRVPYISMGTYNSTNTSAPNSLTSKFFSSASFTLKPYPTSYPNISEIPPVPLPSPINVTYPNATAYPTASGAPILNLPKPFYANFTLPNATNPTNTSLPMGTSLPMSTSVPANITLPTNGTCSVSNPTCPACDNQTLVDNHNVAYTVFCGYSLDATLDYAFGEPTPAAYCMSRCDERNATCFGASWSTEECVLALGDFVGMVVDHNHMAFVRAAIPQSPPFSNTSTPSLPFAPLSTSPSWQNMSRYPEASSASALRPTLIATGQTFATSVLIPTGPAVQPVSSTYPSSTRALPSYGSVVKHSVAPTSVKPTTDSAGEPTPAPWTGGRPPWAHGGGGYGPGAEVNHGPPSFGSWWKGGRPPWAHWGWVKPSWGRDEKDGQKQQ